MNPIDDMFRDGLGGRRGEVPTDMWSRVSAGKASVTPEGEGVDQYFADALKDRAGDVPADMWNRIAATGVPATAGPDEVFSDALRNRKGDVPAGMWDRIWKARTATPALTARRVLSAVVVLLLLLSFGWWLMADDGKDLILPTKDSPTVTAGNTPDVEPSNASGSAAGATIVEKARLEETVAPAEITSSGTGGASPIADRPSARAATEARQNKPTDQVSVSGINPVPNGAVTAAALGADAPAETSPNAEARLEAAARQGGERPDAQLSGSSAPTVAGTDPGPAASALPSLPLNSAIPALEIEEAWDFKVKKGYEPQTPSPNSFRSSYRHRLQTEFLFGAFYANQQFSAETADQRAQRNIREVRENPGLSYQVSLRGAYKLNERLLLRSGLTYSEIRNKFDYERTVNGITSLVTINNQIRQLEVPVLLGLRIPGRRINVSLNAGPLVNLTTGVQGLFLHPDSVDPLSLSDDGQYRKNVGVGFMTSLSTVYVIGKKQPFVLLVEPFFKAYPGSFMRKDAPLKEKYWAAGLQLGVRKGF